VQLDVSPDGGWLVYRTEDARQDLYVARVDGTEQRQVTNDDAKDWSPRWSPDSKRLVFYSNASGRYQIWVVNRDGSGRMRLSDATTGITFDPTWSPDGSEIIYLESGVDSFIVKSDVPFDKQTARPVPRFKGDGGEGPIRASDWNAAGTIAADGIRLYSPAANTFESLLTKPQVNNPRWMRDGRLFYQKADSWFVLDPKTRGERRVEFPGNLNEVAQILLSPDARRAYLMSVTVQGDVWQLEVK